MWGRGTRLLRTTVLAALAGCAGAIPSAAAQGPEFVPLASGSFAQLAATWQASAVRPNTIFLDLYDSTGVLFQSYSPQFVQPPPRRKVTALGYRPLGLPSTASLVGGVAGTRVKKVKVVYADGQSQRFATVPAPPEWAFGGRFFAAGATVADAYASTTQVVTRIRAFDRRGRRLSTQTNVFTNPF